MYKVHSRILREHGSQIRSYVVVDEETERLLCAGQEPMGYKDAARKHRLKAMKEGISHASIVAESNSTIKVYDHQIPHAELVIGRVRSEVSTIIDQKDLSFVFYSDTHDPVDDVAASISQMSRKSDSELEVAISKPEYTPKNPVQLFADGSYKNERNGETAIGYALIDASNTLIALGSHSLPPVVSSLEAEYKAIHAGLNKADKFDTITDVNLISDNMRVIRTLADQQTALDRNQTLVENIRESMSKFENVSQTKKSRDENVLADALATYGHKQTLVGATI